MYYSCMYASLSFHNRYCLPTKMYQMYSSYNLYSLFDMPYISLYRPNMEQLPSFPFLYSHLNTSYTIKDANHHPNMLTM